MIEMVEKYLTTESFKVAGIQAYRGIEKKVSIIELKILIKN